MMNSKMADTPIIIIGAGRSGTNMLRDVLTQLPGFGTWPCDEINYIWRHGNVAYPTDELSPKEATTSVQRFIHHEFEKLIKQQHIQQVVEKTCANSLRVGFVDKIFPEAKYIFLIRDGRDVVASALKRWNASLDLPYILKKARFVPPSDLTYYGSRYVGNRIYRMISGQQRLAFWGPKFQGMKEMLQERSLPEVCAYQWKRCVERSEADFSVIPARRVYKLRYEDLVTDPSRAFPSILDFLEIRLEKQQVSQLCKAISTSSIGKWQSDLSAATIEKITSIMQPLLTTYGYDEQYERVM